MTVPSNELSLGACSAIFDSDGRILLVRKAYGDRGWTLPGGGLEGPETPMDAAVRETLEETGLQTTIERLIGLYVRPIKGRLVFLFAVTPTSGQLLTTVDREIEERAYFSPNQLPTVMSISARLRVRDAVLGQERTFLRVISG